MSKYLTMKLHKALYMKFSSLLRGMLAISLFLNPLTPQSYAKAPLCSTILTGTANSWTSFTHFVRGNNYNKMEYRYKNFQDKRSLFYKDFFNSVGRFLIPVPLPRIKTEVDPIFDKQWKDFNYTPDYIETAILKKNDLYEQFFDRRAALLGSKGVFVARKWMARTAFVYILTAAYLSFIQLQQFAERMFLAEDWLNQPDEKNGHPIVQLIVESTPFPHAAIRIGSKIYSYGVTHMTAKTKWEYFWSNEQLSTKLATLTDETSFTHSALNKLSQSFDIGRIIRAITINLSASEIKKLRFYLEMQTGKRYVNVTGTNDCMSMIARAFQENTSIQFPRIIDPFPNMSALYLELQKTLGSEKIGESSLIYFDKNISKASRMSAVAYMTTLESKTLLNGLLFFTADRARLDFAYKELSYYEPSMEKEITKWRAEAQKSIDLNLDEATRHGKIFDEISKLDPKDPKKPEKIRKAKELIDLLILPELQRSTEALAATESIEFYDIVVHTFKIEYLNQKRSELLKKIKQ